MRLLTKHLLMFAMLCSSGWTFVSASPTKAIDNQCFGLILVDNISHYTTAGELNNYDNRLRLQNINLTPKNLKAGENVFKFYRTDENCTKHVFSELVLSATVTGETTMVIPSIRYYDENDNLTANGGNTTLNYSSRTYANSDTLDLFGIIDYVNDVFSENVAENLHPAAYTYYATFNEQEPGTFNVGDVLGSLDINTLSSGNNTLSSPWGEAINKATNGPGSPYAIINANNGITFTVPEGINNESVTVAITTDNSSQGAGMFIINGNSYTAARNTTNYYVVNNVTSGATITISGNIANSPRILSTSTIYIYFGNYIK